MGFANQILSTDELSTAQVTLSPLSPKYMPLELKIYTILTMVPIFVMVVLGFEWFFEMPEFYMQTLVYWISGIFAIGALIFTYICLAFPKKGYALREHDLHFSSGLIFQSHICQPLLRIQHIEVKRGPFERKAGLATLLVFSAGGVQHTFYIPGLEYDTAIKLRSYILDNRDLKKDETDDSTLTD